MPNNTLPASKSKMPVKKQKNSKKTQKKESLKKQPSETNLNSKPRYLTKAEAAERMLTNARKSIEEHNKRVPNDVYVNVQEGLPSEKELQQKETSTLKIVHKASEAQGIRASMEDAHFYRKFSEGIYAGVFDGHGGKTVSQLANDEFKKQFPEALKKANGNVHKAFETLIDKIHAKVMENKDLEQKGTTAVITYIDTKRHLIYTATIGDSEANIYRFYGSRIKSIPLSVIRDWSSKKEATRAAIATNQPNIIKEYTESPNPKTLRFPDPYGLNVSRAIGDGRYTMINNKPGIIHKPKITINKLYPKDVLILACDGLKDYVPEREIAEIVRQSANQQNVNLAKRLVDFAINERFSRDNVTVIVIKVS